MNLTNYYWYFKSALTPRFCDEVIKYANQQKEVIARTGGFNEKKLTKDFSDEISSWYKNKLPLEFDSYFVNNEFDSSRFINDLATTLAKDYFEEHGFDGFMMSDNIGNFRYYDGGDFINAIGSDIIVANPSDLVPRLKI